MDINFKVYLINKQEQRVIQLPLLEINVGFQYKFSNTSKFKQNLMRRLTYKNLPFGQILGYVRVLNCFTDSYTA